MDLQTTFHRFRSGSQPPGQRQWPGYHQLPDTHVPQFHPWTQSFLLVKTCKTKEMKKISYILSLAAAILLGTGCKKYLDVNTDPNNPADVQENLLLASTETAISTTLAGGALTIGNYTSIGQVTAYWTQQTALNQLPPQNDVYRVRPDDMDQQWLEIYSTIFQNLQLLNNKAEGHGNHAYGVIAKVLTAYTLGIVTD